MADVSEMSDTSSRCVKSPAESEEESESSENTHNGEMFTNQEKNDPTGSSKCDSVRSTPNSFCLRTSKLNPSSSLGLPATPNKPFVLKPPKLSNPFNKIVKEDDTRTDETTGTALKSQSDEPVTPLNRPSVSFLPLGGEASTPSQQSSFSAASAPSLGFVFGQNIHEKVEAATPAESSSSAAAAEPSVSKDVKEVTANGTSSECLFLSQVPKESTERTTDANKSLSEAAREYEEARAVKRKYEEVPVLTGEEEEANILQYGVQNEPVGLSNHVNVFTLGARQCDRGPHTSSKSPQGKNKVRVKAASICFNTPTQRSENALWDCTSYFFLSIKNSLRTNLNRGPSVQISYIHNFSVPSTSISCQNSSIPSAQNDYNQEPCDQNIPGSLYLHNEDTKGPSFQGSQRLSIQLKQKNQDTDPLSQDTNDEVERPLNKFIQTTSHQENQDTDDEFERASLDDHILPTRNNYLNRFARATALLDATRKSNHPETLFQDSQLPSTSFGQRSTPVTNFAHSSRQL